MAEIIIEILKLIIEFSRFLLTAWITAKIVVHEMKKDFYSNIEQEEYNQRTGKEQRRAEWEQWKAQREFEEFEQWKRQKDENAKT